MQNAEGDASVSGRRPIGVWVISIYTVFGAAWILLGTALVYRGVVPLSDPMRAYVASQNALDVGLMLVSVGLNVTGGILLFLLRRQAFGFMLGAFILGLAQVPYHIVHKHWLEAMGPGALVSAVLGEGVVVTVLLYVHWLRRHGVLR